MDSAGYLGHLSRDLSAFEACMGGDLSAPVEHCGTWTLYDLANHMGGGNLWAAAAITELHGDYDAAPAPRDPGALPGWLRGTGQALLEALDRDPSATAWTIAPPPTVGFWQRRRCLETLIHRWDAERAVGGGGEMDAELSDDGIAEVIDTMAPRQVRLGRASAPAHAIGLNATDTGSRRVLGPGDPVATVSGTAADLLLLLWGRRAAGDPAIAWQGDRDTAEAVLRGALVP
jgi:uncharacterized protein (TIGR03083 family)